MTLSLFDRWLKSNRILHFKHLIAYLSLKSEGNCHVKQATLDTSLTNSLRTRSQSF